MSHHQPMGLGSAEPFTIVDLDTQPEGYKPDGLAAERWAPDIQLIPAILVTPQWPRRLTEYDEADRSWIVAGLGLAGWSANEIVDRVGGSIRLIRDIRSRPMTEACRLWQLEIGRIEAELRVERINHTATTRELWASNSTIDRQRKQLSQILDKLSAGTLEAFPRCGHPKVDWNIYRYTDRSGAAPREREVCRECNNDRASQYRSRRKSAGKTSRSHNGVTLLQPASVASAS